MNPMPPELSNMTPEQKRALLSQLLRDKARCARSYRLSFAQERLWFIDQFQQFQQSQPGLPVYNIPLQLRFPGPFSMDALQRTLNEITRRHEALRTTFRVEDGQPVQRISPAKPVPVPVVDLGGLPPATREAEAQRVAAREASHHFDLSAGPLFRALLIRLDAADHILALTMHHIVSDGWSVGVLMRELGALYPAFGSGKPSPLPELPLQYADYAEKQRDALTGATLASQLAFWKEQLAGAPLVLNLSTDRPRPAVQTFQGAWQPFAVDPALSHRLKQLSLDSQATLFMTLLAAFEVLLYRYSGQADFMVGTPIANRTHAEIEGLIGFFVNTLALRADLTGQPSFREVLARTRETTLGAYSHQEMPFEKLVEELQPDRNLSISPLFQVMFSLQNAPSTAMEASTAPTGSAPSNQPPPVFQGTAKFDLTLSISETAGGLASTFEYNTDLFDHATITRMIGHFQTLLAGIAASPDQSVATLPMLTAEERETALVAWNATDAEYPHDRCVHELFEDQVDRNPDKVAVVFGDAELSYGELDRRANQLAHHLRALGIGPEMRVGLCLERSLEMVVGILGILKAGGAYVPLDPEHPGERLRFLLEDAQVKALLTLERHVHRIDFDRAPMVRLDADWAGVAENLETRPPTEIDPDHVIAVFYTSGSTGKPKGSLGHGRGYVNLFHWYRSCLADGEDIRALLMTPFTFDASFKNIMTPLLYGGTTILAGMPAYDMEQLIHTIETQRPTTTFTTPSLLYAILELAKERDYQSLSSLTTLFFGGEPTEVARLRHWLASRHCNCRLRHIYGPSECSDVTTIFVPTAEQLATWSALPIGKPINNAKVYVLDENLEPLPVGVPGELCIGGLPLTRGYLDRPVLTAEKFVANRFRPGERLYRTGDRVRWLSSGDLEFLGRTDLQVKIRGIRVELGEIESVLAQHPDVDEAVVVPHEDKGSKQLVGYVVPVAGSSLTMGELRSHLSRQLPEHMVPASLRVLDELPRSPNGKIDRNALPGPDMSTAFEDEDLASPRNALDEVLAGIWVDILNHGRVSIHDNFFALGGHSLLATQVISRIREALEIEVPLRRIFEAPTIAAFTDSLLADPATAERAQTVASLLTEITALSDDEARALLAQEDTTRA